MCTVYCLCVRACVCVLVCMCVCICAHMRVCVAFKLSQGVAFFPRSSRFDLFHRVSSDEMD